MMGMISDIFGHRCIFCGERGKNTRPVHMKTDYSYPWYNKGGIEKKVYNYYHNSCLLKVLKSPDTVYESTVKLALKIVNRIKLAKKHAGYAEHTQLRDKLRKISYKKKLMADAKAAYKKVI